ncbi:carbonic anhydrase family protein [Microbulbifer guangxiensis]|uniref:carbonic anhydrase family protein n=1 Tax=Microbulbifer guangxiensis TaxID=2904249 RepID=UPI001EEE0FA9|nr:carbonic anhydrase family protein [Microbulbifer guangxiensis]
MSDNKVKPVSAVTENADTCCSRRQWLKGALGASALGIIGGAGLAGVPGISFAQALSKEERDKLTPDEVIRMLQEGNKRFRTGKMEEQDYLAQKRSSVSGQYPAAAILSCIDSRTPAEILLDQGIGDVFNARVAGNICSDDILGSLEFACAAAGSKVVLVMGHTACGAVKGAIDGVEMGNLTGLLDHIEPAIKATEYEGERSSENPEFVDRVVVTNVRRTMDEIRRRSQVLSGLEKEGKIKIVGSLYHLNDGRLEMLA